MRNINFKTALLIVLCAVVSAPSAFLLMAYLSISPFVATCFFLGACLAVVMISVKNPAPDTQEDDANE